MDDNYTNKREDLKKIEAFEKNNVIEVLDLIESLPIADFKAEKDCLIHELKKLNKYKIDELVFKRFISTRTKQDFKIKVGHKIFNFINPEFEFSISLNELKKNPLAIAYAKCMFRNRVNIFIQEIKNWHIFSILIGVVLILIKPINFVHAEQRPLVARLAGSIEVVCILLPIIIIFFKLVYKNSTK